MFSHVPSRRPVNSRHPFSGVLELERRLCLAADIAVAIEPQSAHGGDAATQSMISTSIEVEDASRIIVFVDSGIDDVASVLSSISSQATIVFLDATKDPLEQITAKLRGFCDVRSVHLISHGSSGELRLCGQVVDLARLEKQSLLLNEWSSYLAKDADVLIYGCNVAAGTQGQRFVRRLSELTQSDVAASNDLTGSIEANGNWVLEEKVGMIESGLVVGIELQTRYTGVLKFCVDAGAVGGNFGEDEDRLRCHVASDGHHAPIADVSLATLSMQAPPVMHTLIDYDHFTDTSELAFNGSASANGGGLELTPCAGGLGSAFSSRSLAVNEDTSFQTQFRFRMEGAEGTAGADGIVFMLQNDMAGLNAISCLNGESLGYQGIRNSIAIEFDTFHNRGDINNNHVSFFVDGDMQNPLATQAVGFDLNSGQVVHAWIDYDGRTNRLSVYLSEAGEKPEEAVLSTELDLAGIVGEAAYAGFSAATGSHINRHEILDWRLEATQPAMFHDEDVVLEWIDVMLDANAWDHSGGRPDQGGPVLTARAFAMISGAMYDAYNSINPIGTSFEFNVQPLSEASVDAAVAQAAHDMLVALYPKQKARFHNELAQTLGRIENGSMENEGRRVGSEIAARTLQARTSDDMSLINDPNYSPKGLVGFHDVDPLNPRQGFYGTGAARIAPFVLNNLSDFSIPALDDGTEAGRFAFLSSQLYTDDYNEVKQLGGMGPETLRNSEQTEIGIYWAYDGRPGLGTPPRLYNQVVKTVAIQEGNSESQNARLFALVNIAQADAGLASWDSKYQNDLWRPVIGIRQGDLDGNESTVGDSDWIPLGAPASNPRSGESNFTPNFPAYTSGHATFGAAAFEILKDFYGKDDIAFSFISDEYNGITLDANGEVRPVIERSFNSFTEAKVENAISRIYLGVHWRIDATEGIVMGDRVADYVFANSLLPIS